MKIRRLFPALVGLAFLSVMIYQGGLGLVKLVAWRALSTERPLPGSLEKTTHLKALVIREEIVLTAPAGGILKRVVPEAERVAAGGTIAQIKLAGVASGDTGIRSITAPFAGQVCYHPDGLENVLRPGIWEKMSYHNIFSLTSKATQFSPGETVQAGEPLIRLVNNLHPLFLYIVVDEVPPEWKLQKQVSLLWPGQEDRLKLKVANLYMVDNRAVLVLRLDNWGNEWLDKRLVELEAVVERYPGFILPRQALVTLPDGSKGVYVLSGREVRFQEVQVVGMVGDKMSVKGVNPNVEVVINPFWTRWL
ncbi:putative membrane fusion protein [Thermanaeromonas toyohensis ToBE]|uniref:Putative membrane fusion protein n=1 Tax=Thermanaeromonas toyohensis ToBE TaxID=698762 RepID=A0A1W1VM37_9FIRM|nr:HlyD family efflux transporter periplasmic adaptor subunit [Thermanaeromonas toyohensis]SMB94417.1 putative membrane fusion protein [Thermanaeromonas toyohensis ToBE]